MNGRAANRRQFSFVVLNLIVQIQQRLYYTDSIERIHTGTQLNAIKHETSTFLCTERYPLMGGVEIGEGGERGGRERERGGKRRDRQTEGGRERERETERETERESTNFDSLLI